jgi:hypothetical protein
MSTRLFVTAFITANYLASLTCVSAAPSTRPIAATAPATQPDPDATARAIDAIIYSDLSKEEMLKRLKPFAAVMESADEFKAKTGLKFSWDSTATGSKGWPQHVEGCGLILWIDDAESRIRMIFRQARIIRGVEFPATWLSDPSR